MVGNGHVRGKDVTLNIKALRFDISENRILWNLQNSIEERLGDHCVFGIENRVSHGHVFDKAVTLDIKALRFNAWKNGILVKNRVGYRYVLIKALRFNTSKDRILRRIPIEGRLGSHCLFDVLEQSRLLSRAWQGCDFDLI